MRAAWEPCATHPRARRRRSSRAARPTSRSCPTAPLTRAPLRRRRPLLAAAGAPAAAAAARRARPPQPAHLVASCCPSAGCWAALAPGVPAGALARGALAAAVAEHSGRGGGSKGEGAEVDEYEAAINELQRAGYSISSGGMPSLKQPELGRKSQSYGSMGPGYMLSRAWVAVPPGGGGGGGVGAAGGSGGGGPEGSSSRSGGDATFKVVSWNILATSGLGGVARAPARVWPPSGAAVARAPARGRAANQPPRRVRAPTPYQAAPSGPGREVPPLARARAPLPAPPGRVARRPPPAAGAQGACRSLAACPSRMLAALCGNSTPPPPPTTTTTTTTTTGGGIRRVCDAVRVVR